MKYLLQEHLGFDRMIDKVTMAWGILVEREYESSEAGSGEGLLGVFIDVVCYRSEERIKIKGRG